ncbi:maleylpyruvate isomerase N-terminal domain-containing protein [Streptomyces tropicalis]|uniref:Zf-HC2 domain-containing protein n=1 Tax=Streptomyces tropicalis TaxID=3034234 RepID=A0ABT6A790_9ACTN|nr:zf-HC2 domain-containing protein [Streptomyces tropicalis]MDF3300507.1 zf-HC2 domain-containing protein [Streptomyces tropicalis]
MTGADPHDDRPTSPAPDAEPGPGPEGTEGPDASDGPGAAHGPRAGGDPGDGGTDASRDACGPGAADGAGGPGAGAAGADGPGGPGGAGAGGAAGPGGVAGTDGGGPGADGAPRIPLPRASVEDGGQPLPGTRPAPPPAPLVLDHHVLKSLLGAWALAACSPEETAAVEEHLGDCGGCADEALRLRAAVGLLHPPESLDLDPGLRTRVLQGCLDRRPPRIPVPPWATPYDAETARLDALLQDIGDDEWDAPVRLRWFERDEETSRRTTVAGVIAHLLSVDGLVGVALGLDDPLADLTDPDEPSPARRTEAYWRASRLPPSRTIRAPWRDQTHALVRTVGFTGGTSGGLGVSYGDFVLPLRDAMLDRAFECWVHAEDIAEAVDYPYEPPAPRHLHEMIDLAARMLPVALAARRQVGLSGPAPARHLVAAGTPGRSLRLEIEGLGGGEWLIPLDSPGAIGSADHEVAHVALDGVEFCRLAAGHVTPQEAAAGQVGDRDAIRDVLHAAASLSRM